MGVAVNALLVAEEEGPASGVLLVGEVWAAANRLLLVVEVEAATVEVLFWVAACIENTCESMPLFMPGTPTSSESA